MLAAAVDHVAANGAGGLSLRRLATAVGTSHRMLIYHFGSLEGLLVEVTRTVEARQRQVLGELVVDPDAPPGEIMWRFWRRLADPELRPLIRLFFELYGQALQGRPGTAAFLDEVVDRWVQPATEAAVRQGVPVGTARARARLGLATVRGLLLDLLTTGDEAGVDQAVREFISLYDLYDATS